MKNLNHLADVSPSHSLLKHEYSAVGVTNKSRGRKRQDVTPLAENYTPEKAEVQQRK